MGKLKKSVKGLVIVHPMTKIGKELRIEVMTGYAPKNLITSDGDKRGANSSFLLF